MKQISQLIIILLLLGFISCKSDGQSSSNRTAKASENSNRETDEEGETSTDLTDIAPLTESEFKEAYPKSINGWPLDEAVKVFKQQAVGEYGDGKLRLNIQDMAGKHSGYFASAFLTTYNTKLQDDETTQHIHKERDGIKTIATYNAGKNKSMVSFIHHARWLVVLNSNDMNPDELWKTFDRNTLKNFK